MSWLGGSFSSLTGQLSNLTKDILTEGTEEVGDPETELSLAKEKIQQLDTLLSSQKQENDRLKRINKELEEKAESAELQINTIAREYRTLLENKEKEVNSLKHQYQELLEQHACTAGLSSSSESSGIQQGNKPGQSPIWAATMLGGEELASLNYDNDPVDWDFDDSIRLQRENNNLSAELQHLQSEAKHWRSVAVQLGKNAGHSSNHQATSAEVLDLQDKVKRLEAKLLQKQDELQQQAASLQEHHQQKISSLKSHKKSEVDNLNQQLASLERQLADAQNGSVHSQHSGSGNLPEFERPQVSKRDAELQARLSEALHEKEKAHNARRHLQGVLEELQHEVEVLQQKLQQQPQKDRTEEERKIAELTQCLQESEMLRLQLETELQEVRKELLQTKHRLLDQLDANHADAQEVLTELRELKENLNTDADYRRDKMRAERRTLVNQLFRVGQQKNQVTKALQAVQQEQMGALAKTEAVIQSIADGQQQKLTAELLDTLEKENLLLKEEKLKLEEQVALLEKISFTADAERQALQQRVTALKSHLLSLTGGDNCDTEYTLDDDLSIDNSGASRNRNAALYVGDDEVEKELACLRAQLTRQKDNLSEVEMERADWQMEREALEDVITDLRKQTQNQELEIKSLKSGQTGSISFTSQAPSDEDSSEKLQALQNEIASLREEKSELENAVEELNTQHSQAQEQLIRQREQLATQLAKSSVQIQHQQEQIDHLNAVLAELRQCEDGEQVKLLKAKCQQLETQVAEAKSQPARSSGAVEKEMADLREKLQNVGLVINDLHMDKQELENELKAAKEEISVKVSKMKEMREENMKLVNEKKDLEKQLLEMEDKLTEMEEEVDNWQQVNEERQVQQMKIGKEHEECQQLRSQLADMEKEKQQFHVIFQNIDDEKLETKFSLQDDIFRRVLEEEAKVRHQIEEDHRVIEELKQQLEKLYDRKEDLKLQLLELQKAHEEDKAKVTGLESKCEDLSLFLEVIKNAKLDLEQKFNTDLAKMQVTEGKLEEAGKQNKELFGELSVLMQEKSELENQLKSQQKHYDAYIEELKAGQKLGAKSFQPEHRTVPREVLSLRQADGIRLEELGAKTIVKLTQDLSVAQETIKNQEAGITDLNEKVDEQRKTLQEAEHDRTRQKTTIAVLRQSSLDKENLMNEMEGKLKFLLPILTPGQIDKLRNFSQNAASIPALEYQEMRAIEYSNRQSSSRSSLLEFQDSEQSSALQTTSQLMMEEKPDYEVNGYIIEEFRRSDRVSALEKELDELRQHLKEKDCIVEELQKSNSSLLSLLEKGGIATDKSEVATHKLEAELRSLRAEREQMVAVVTEKSRENSSLKTEVHRLMEIVSAGQAALEKLQQDNINLEQRQQTPPRDAGEDDMRRETLANMVRLIRDRETEIEALKQKNETLLAILQETGESNTAAHLISLLRDKDTLAQQVTNLTSEREQLIACITQKHSESLAYHAELQRLHIVLAETQEAKEMALKDYQALIPSFEDKSQALLATQNELVKCKQKLVDLEVRHGILIQRSSSQDSPNSSEMLSLKYDLERFRLAEHDLRSTLSQREEKIQTLMHQISSLEENYTAKDNECAHYRKQAENCRFQLTGLMTEIADMKTEREQIQQKTSAQDTESAHLRDTYHKMLLAGKEKELEMSSLKEQVTILTSLLSEQQGEQGQVATLMKEKEATLASARQLQHERDQQALLAEQRLGDTHNLTAQLTHLKNKELKLTREVERLRGHLIQIEEGYTREALESEEREKELRNRLAKAEEQLVSSSSKVELASQESTRQIGSLQQQLQQVANQRDSAYMQVTNMQEQCQQYAASLSNLQLVLEHFQKEKDLALDMETERLQNECKVLKIEVKELQAELEVTRSDLTEALDGLEAASRLAEQLDKKEEALSALKEEVQLREKALNEAEEKIHKLTSSTEAKVDKMLMHNMVMTWLTSPENKRMEIVHLIGHILNFSPEDLQRIDVAQGRGGIFSGIFLRPSSSPHSTPSKHSSSDQSFSQLFVKFLERESSPPPTPVRLPVEAMAAETQHRHKQAAFNPFTAPRHVTHDGTHSSSSSSHILMTPDSPTSMPLFTPLTSTPSTLESAILKDVLGKR